jgi:hypothetical protein
VFSKVDGVTNPEASWILSRVVIMSPPTVWFHLSCFSISIATNTGRVFNTRFLLYLIHNIVVLRTNKRYCAQCVHSDTARESQYIIKLSIQESWIVVKFVTQF